MRENRTYGSEGGAAWVITVRAYPYRSHRRGTRFRTQVTRRHGTHRPTDHIGAERDFERRSPAGAVRTGLPITSARNAISNAGHPPARYAPAYVRSRAHIISGVQVPVGHTLSGPQPNVTAMSKE